MISHSTTTHASRDIIWSLWTNPEQRPHWDQTLTSCTLSGPFQAGDHIQLGNKTGKERTVTLINVTDQKEFTTEESTELATIKTHHVMQDYLGKTKVTHQVTIIPKNEESQKFVTEVLYPSISEALAPAVEKLREIAENVHNYTSSNTNTPLQTLDIPLNDPFFEEKQNCTVPSLQQLIVNKLFAKREQLANILLKADTWDQLAKQLHGIPGMQLRRYDYASDEAFIPLSTWQARDGDINGTPTNVPIHNIDLFLCPEGTSEITCDFTDPSHTPVLQTLLSSSQKVDRLVTEGSLDDHLEAMLFHLDKQSLLGQIHTLVIHGATINVKALQILAEKFTNIACFDLRECKLEGENPLILETCLDLLRNTHILLENTRDNMQEQYNDLNAHLKAFVQSYTLQGFGLELYNGDAARICRHPAAPFMQVIAFLKNTLIRDGHLHSVAPALKRFFPNMQILDLSGCPNLCVNALQTIHYLSPQEVYLAECHRIMSRRLPNAQAQDILQHPEVLAQGNPHGEFQVSIPELDGSSQHYTIHGPRVWQHQPDMFTQIMMDLYLDGVETIRLDGVQGVKACIDKGVGSAIVTMARRTSENVRLHFYDAETNSNKTFSTQ